MAFFSGQDTKTLQSEGNDTNCFVSLIVDTKGTYQAAITRKLKSKVETIRKDLGSSYEFFGEGPITSSLNGEEKNESESAVIEYFMLDVQIEPVNNPLSYLDMRFEEIEAQKKVVQPTLPTTSSGYKIPSVTWNSEGGLEKYWEQKDVETEEKWPKEQYLFSEDEMGEIKWNPDPTIIHRMLCQMVTSSLIINENLDLKQWIVRHMEKLYNNIFDGPDDFAYWADNLIEFVVQHYRDDAIPGELLENEDFLYAKVSEALLNELGEYPTNTYIDILTEELMKKAYD